MTGLGVRFAMGVEHELMTLAAPVGRAAALRRVLQVLAVRLPSMQAAGHGFFTPYGRYYLDVAEHLELASAECDDPYRLALLVETQMAALTDAVAQLRAAGVTIDFANNNHDGLLHHSTSTWGTHENYLVGAPPPVFARAILPFLVTRVFAGAGGVVFPTAERVAGVRPLFLCHETGGATTSARAIFSTARNEPLAGRLRSLHRCHLINGDGHRSQFNLALQFGATALVFRALETDAELPAQIEAVCRDLRLPLDGSWLTTLHACNRLAAPDEELHVQPAAIQMQTFFLHAARRWAERAGAVPAWVPRCLRDWEDTLVAMDRRDNAWLAARLDAFAKLGLLEAVLAAKGTSFGALPNDAARLRELSLVDQSYHTLGDPRSAFTLLERGGRLAHRVGAAIAPGAEAEAFVPDVQTRARARARYLVEHRGVREQCMDWADVIDPTRTRARALHDPFALEYGEWKDFSGARRAAAVEGDLPF